MTNFAYAAGGMLSSGRPELVVVSGAGPDGLG
jgi:hypothetical protein